MQVKRGRESPEDRREKKEGKKAETIAAYVMTTQISFPVKVSLTCRSESEQCGRQPEPRDAHRE